MVHQATPRRYISKASASRAAQVIDQMETAGEHPRAEFRNPAWPGEVADRLRTAGSGRSSSDSSLRLRFRGAIGDRRDSRAANSQRTNTARAGRARLALRFARAAPTVRAVYGARRK